MYFPTNYTPIALNVSLKSAILEPLANILTVELIDAEGNFFTLEAIENAILLKAVAYYNYNLTEVSKALQIGRSTLYRRLDQIGYKRP